MVVQGVHGVEAHEISLLQFLVYTKQSGGIEPLTTIEKGHQESKFVGGAMTISERLAANLGDHVKLNSPVLSINQEEKEIAVETPKFTFHCSYVVVACAPVISAKIRYLPPMPIEREHLTQRSFMGSIIKILVLYANAFWVDKGFSGEVVHDLTTGPAFNVYDDTRADPKR